MRSSKNRSRSKGNRNRSVGNIVNRVFDSSGPEGKVRGTPQQIIDKYNQLARDAQLSNDRVAAENFQQHAEHYTRMLSLAQREMDQRREQQEAQQQQRRDRSQDRDQDQPQQPGTGEQPVVEAAPEKPVANGFDDVIDSATPDGGMEIVETAEEAPKPRNRRRRKPAAEAQPAEAEVQPVEAETQPAPDSQSDTPPEAAE